MKCPHVLGVKELTLSFYIRSVWLQLIFIASTKNVLLDLPVVFFQLLLTNCCGVDHKKKVCVTLWRWTDMVERQNHVLRGSRDRCHVWPQHRPGLRLAQGASHTGGTSGSSHQGSSFKANSKNNTIRRIGKNSWLFFDCSIFFNYSSRVFICPFALRYSFTVVLFKALHALKFHA